MQAIRGAGDSYPFRLLQYFNGFNIWTDVTSRSRDHSKASSEVLWKPVIKSTIKCLHLRSWNTALPCRRYHHFKKIRNLNRINLNAFFDWLSNRKASQQIKSGFSLSQRPSIFRAVEINPTSSWHQHSALTTFKTNAQLLLINLNETYRNSYGKGIMSPFAIMVQQHQLRCSGFMFVFKFGEFPIRQFAHCTAVWSTATE